MVAPEIVAALIGDIYEASAFPDRWPDILQKIGTAFGARGGNLIRSTATELEIHSSSAVASITADFAKEGWNANNSRVSRRLALASYPGFLADSDLHTAHELDTLPMYREFLTPRGMAAGAGTIVQGAANDALIIAIEGFPSHEASRAAGPALDMLRPHLARASILSSEIELARRTGLVEAFTTTGSAIGLLDSAGRLLAASDLFSRRMEGVILDGGRRLRMIDDNADQSFVTAISGIKGNVSGLSIALRDENGMGAAVLHLIPARNDARDLFGRVTIFAMLAYPDNEMLPDADIIAALFDLTPAEAKIARGIAEGLTPADLARQLNVSVETVRTQLKRVYSKTSTGRQNELSLLISRFRG